MVKSSIFFLGSWLRRYWKHCLLVLVLLLFVVLFVLDVINAGEAAALSTPVLAALVAFSLYETVHEKRLEDRKQRDNERETELLRRDAEREQDRRSSVRQKRSDAYIGIIEHGIRSFTSTGFQNSEESIRAQIALWGSPQFVEAYLSWRHAISPYTGQGQVAVGPTDKPAIQESLAELIRAARVDVDIDPKRLASTKALASVLFDDYK